MCRSSLSGYLYYSVKAPRLLIVSLLAVYSIYLKQNLY